MSALEIVNVVVLITHFLGLATIIGAFFMQMRKRSGVDFRLIVIGAAVQLLTGLALIGLLYAQDESVNNTKIAVKLILALVVLVAALVGRKAKKQLPFLHTAGAAAIANVIIAVAWS
jgi:FtsH-binding integral membrane protein